MTPPSTGIGHNQGPPLIGAGSWAGYCWRRARREVWDNPPVEVIRRRKRRAEELGLSYAQYAPILLDKGVRTEALVFDLSGLSERAPAAPLERMAAKLRTLRHCTVFAATTEAAHMFDGLNARTGGIIADCARFPRPPAGRRRDPWARPPRLALDAFLQPVLGMLARHAVAPAAAVMIGDGVGAERIAESARLARVFGAADYFQ